MFVTDGQSGAGRLAAERGRQADAAVYLAAISAAVLGEQILTCKHTEGRLFSWGSFLSCRERASHQSRGV